MTMPVQQPETTSIWKSRYGWTIIAFIIAGVFISGLVIWQLMETAPAYWCALADQTSEGLRTACYNVLLRLLDIKDHAIVGLLTILGITVASVVAVALGVKISGTGPGGTSVNVGADETRVKNGDLDMSIPTPPSEDKDR